ncbi:MAG TPA: hypothetical protein VE863_08750 [Pyrinomonadaceae bacterium]|nr:hypothetical protein [Pyrinomonadaceae bacterium]
MERQRLGRIRYWPGQRLRSTDFTANQKVEEQRRWWHNRAEHEAFGIASGLSTEAIDSNLSGVAVSPGLAYDCFGRELVLQEARLVPLPEFADGLYLIIRYADRVGRSPGPHCCETTAAPATGNVDFVWQSKSSFNFTDGVPLAETRLDHGGKTLAQDFFRLPLRPRARPLIATGTTISGKTLWAVNEIDPGTLEVFTDIDTSAAGFTAVPCYFAWLEGPLVDPRRGNRSPIVLTRVTNEATDKFRFSYWYHFRSGVIASHTMAMQSSATSVPRPDLYVAWMACQMPPTLPFVPPGGRASNQFVLNSIISQQLRNEV